MIDDFVSLPMTSRGSRGRAHTTAKLRTEHASETGRLQGLADRLTAVVGWPGFVAALTFVLVLWVVGNLAINFSGGRAPDPPPFSWLQGAVATGALYVAALILTTQRRKEELSSHREQLLVELAILNDQKVSKLIELHEERRPNDPTINDRRDEEAKSMSRPSDPDALSRAIKDK